MHGEAPPTFDGEEAGLAMKTMQKMMICRYIHASLSLTVQDLKIRSSHDVLREDPKLSSQPALDLASQG